MKCVNISSVVESDKCTGCMVCENVCKEKAISFRESEEGFWYPQVNQSCISCRKCIENCPQCQPMKKNNSPELYAMRTNSMKCLVKSASGGIFSELAKQFLSSENYICAARWDKSYTKVYHDITNNLDELEYYISSKYVQSSMENIYDKMDEVFQKSEKKIIFCGTPCQAAGVRMWSQSKGYQNRIFICDILCFGVPSQKVYQDYRKYMIEKYENSEIVKFNFRSKKNGWCNYSIEIDFKNGENYTAGKFEDPLYRGFMKQYFCRMSCYQCKFAQMPRVGDISLGDFWGAQKGYYNFYGVSLVSVNNDKGKELISNLSTRHVVKSEKISFDMASPYNKRLSNGQSDIPKVRKNIYKEMNKNGFEYIVSKYLFPEEKKVQQEFAYKHIKRKEEEESF